MAYKMKPQPRKRMLDTTARRRVRRGGVVAVIAAVLGSTTWNCQNFDFHVTVGVSVTPASRATVTK